MGGGPSTVRDCSLLGASGWSAWAIGGSPRDGVRAAAARGLAFRHVYGLFHFRWLFTVHVEGQVEQFMFRSERARMHLCATGVPSSPWFAARKLANQGSPAQVACRAP